MKIKRLNSDILFESGHLSKDLARKTVSGGVVTMTAQGLQFCITTASTMVLARLLSPEDYGIVAMATVVTGFVRMFKDAGLSMATIQQEKITREQISTLFWINVLISATLGLLVLASAPLVGLFYKRPELVPVTAFLSINFVIGGLTLQHNALLRRHMMFKAQRTILIGSQIVGLTISIMMAYKGFRYWALVWGTLVTSVVSIGQTWFYCSWIPGRMEKGKGVRKMLKFGGYLTGANLAHYFSGNGDYILIGRFIGADALGLYAKSYSLLQLPLKQFRGPLSSVAMPALSAIKNDPERYKKYFYRLFEIISTFAAPLTIYCAIEADFIIRIFLGEKWLASVPVFRMLAISGIVLAVANSSGLVLVSMGLGTKYLTTTIVKVGLLVIAFIIGLSHGIIGVATAYSVFWYLFFLPFLVWCFKGTPVTLSGFLRSVWVPVAIGLGCGLTIAVPKYLLNLDSLPMHIVYAFVFGSIYLSLSWLRPNFRDTFNITKDQLLRQRRPVLEQSKMETI